MNQYLYKMFVAVFFLLLSLGQGMCNATVLFSEHPMDVEAVPDEWVQFNCTVNCSYTVWWFIAGDQNPIKVSNSVPGLVIRRTTSRCTSSHQMTHFFEVQATKALDGSVFYCGAQPEGSQARQAPSSCRCVGGRCYSRPALLIVNTTTSALKSAGMMEVTSASSPSCTVQGTIFSEMFTMTSTVTVTVTAIPTTTHTPTVTPTPTNCPNLGLTTSAHMQNSNVQAASVKASSVQAAILAGLGIAASILLL